MTTQHAESLVFIDDAPCILRYRRPIAGSFCLYRFEDGQKSRLTEGQDYTVDYKAGTIAALPGRIRNYRESVFYRVSGFDHTQYKVWGNGPFTYYADYSFDEAGQTTNRQKALELAAGSPKIASLPTQARLVIFGDSISTGAEATNGETAYFGLFAKALHERFGSEIALINGSVGGDTSSDGLKRFERDALAHRPDLCLLAFGMNDQNRAETAGAHFVEPALYENNLDSMITRLLAAGSAVVLISPCRPNPRWRWASGDIDPYRDVLRRLSEKYRLPFADVTALWDYNLACGKTHESLLHNDINHPNDFGHSIYADALCALLG